MLKAAIKAAGVRAVMNNEEYCRERMYEHMPPIDRETSVRTRKAGVRAAHVLITPEFLRLLGMSY
jgi:hypothetical protein